MTRWHEPPGLAREAASRRQAQAVEVLLIMAICVVLSTLVAKLGVALFRKVWMVEVVVSLGGLRIDSVERFALSGRWLKTGAVAAHDERGDSAQARRSEAEEIGLEFRRAPPLLAADPKESAWPPPATARIQTVRVAAVRQGVVDGTLVVVGRFGDREDDFGWALRPAVQVASPPMVVVWLCGAGQPGPRWQSTVPLDWPGLRADGWCRAEGLQ